MQRLVLQHVEKEYGKTEKPWSESFEYLLDRTLINFDGLNIGKHRTMLLRDINALLYDIIEVNLDESEDEMVGDDQALPHVSWKEVDDEGM